MKERPILFSGPMVRAILDGRKTQTRRIIKLPIFGRSDTPGYDWSFRDRRGLWNDYRNDRIAEVCPYGKSGDRLWVREKFGYSRQVDDINGSERVVCYAAGHPFHVTDASVDALKRCHSGNLMQPNHFVHDPIHWRPSIHMPRWASRITLEIMGIKIERVQDIYGTDVLEEGLGPDGLRQYYRDLRQQRTQEGSEFDGPGDVLWDWEMEWRVLWGSIHGVGSWDTNPWVWAITFRRIT
jgi:hypothetical protein